MILIVSLSYIYFLKGNEKKTICLIDEMQYKENLLFDLLIDNVSQSSDIIYNFDNIKDSIFQRIVPPFLIYRYSENMCLSCIKEDFSLLQKFCAQNNDCEVLIIPDYSKSRENEIFLNNQLRGFKYINIESVVFPMPRGVNGEKKRYFAVVNSEKKLQKIFFPHKGLTKLTDYYFSKMK